MSAKIGEPAPDFSLKYKNDDGLHDVSLRSYRGKNVVLLFVPLAYTGVCTDELCTVSQGLESYHSFGAEVLGISVDSPFVLEAWAQDNGISIPLLSDFNREVSRAYGCLYDNFLPEVLGYHGVAKRSAFIVDANGILRWANVLEDAGDLPDFTAIRQVLQGLAQP